QLFITVEPTDLNLITETKGVLWMEGAIKGKATHGSMPWLGKNPIELFHQNLKRFYSVFPSSKTAQWKTTCNIGTVQSGDCVNRTPTDLTFNLDIRYVAKDNPKKIIEQVKKCFPGTSWKVMKCDPPQKKPRKKRWIQKIQKAGKAAGIKIRTDRASYATDARFFSAAGIDSVVFGAIGKGMHGADEWVDLKSLETLFEVLKNVLQ
ncbi:MAG: M20/M25/M40 family metallo-hydrolase, partial [Candidatus Peregrinibacteria bacterium]